MAKRALPTLDLSGSSSQLANNWKKWKRAFEYYAEGKGLDNTRKKTSRLLLCRNGVTRYFRRSCRP